MGETIETLTETFDIVKHSDWDEIVNDRQAMCEVGLSGTIWDKIQLAYEDQYSDSERFKEYFDRKLTWQSIPNCGDWERYQDPRACGWTKFVNSRRAFLTGGDGDIARCIAEP